MQQKFTTTNRLTAVEYFYTMEHIPMMTSIPLRKINIRDKRFRISHPSADEQLLSSIKRVGIIEPAVLIEGPLFSVVTGFRRIEAAKKLGLKKVPAVTVKLGEKEALLFAIHNNLHRGLNIVEKAHALDKMVRMGFSESEIYEVMALLSLGPHEKILAHFLSIARAEEPLKSFIIGHALSLKSIEYLLWFGKEERKKIMTALAATRLTESYLREILEMFHLMKVKKGRFVSGVLKYAANAPELRARLKKITHPRLSSLERKLEEIRKASALPPALDIRVDPFFEKEYIDITIRAKSEKEAKELLGKLDEVLQKGHIRSILELTKGRVR
jgi:ParB/RepB/Spo0J family partition protein